MKVLLHEMSWKEAKEYFAKNDIAIIPVGSNEQHGPPNPLGTDHLIAKGIAEEAARRTGTLCLQVIPFGVSSHHRQLWGTIFISPDIFKEYVKEACTSLMYYGVRKIVIVNGHGGNLAALTQIARQLREEGVFVTIFQWWRASEKLSKTFKEEERGHAGAEETSMNMALHRRLVDCQRFFDETPRTHPLAGEGITLPLDTTDESDSGVFGKQTSASAEKGKKILRTVVDELIEHIRLLKKTKLERLMPKPRA